MHLLCYYNYVCIYCIYIFMWPTHTRIYIIYVFDIVCHIYVSTDFVVLYCGKLPMSNGTHGFLAPKKWLRVGAVTGYGPGVPSNIIVSWPINRSDECQFWMGTSEGLGLGWVGWLVGCLMLLKQTTLRLCHVFFSKLVAWKEVCIIFVFS